VIAARGGRGARGRGSAGAPAARRSRAARGARRPRRRVVLRARSAVVRGALRRARRKRQELPAARGHQEQRGECRPTADAAPHRAQTSTPPWAGRRFPAGGIIRSAQSGFRCQ
jgi:hypothetical protein